MQYYRIKIKMICIPIKNNYISPSFKSFENKKKWFAFGDIFFAFAKLNFLVETYFCTFDPMPMGRLWMELKIMLLHWLTVFECQPLQPINLNVLVAL